MKSEVHQVQDTRECRLLRWFTSRSEQLTLGRLTDLNLFLVKVHTQKMSLESAFKYGDLEAGERYLAGSISSEVQEELNDVLYASVWAENIDWIQSLLQNGAEIRKCFHCSSEQEEYQNIRTVCEVWLGYQLCQAWRRGIEVSMEPG
jgi:hypothetical protein